MDGPDDLVRKLAESAAAMKRMQKPAIKNVGALVRVRMLRAGQAAAGPDLRFSNLKKSKAVLGVRVRVSGDGDSAEAAIEATGPWGISDSDYPGYVITASMPGISRKGLTRAGFAQAKRQRDLDIAFGARGTFAGLKPMGKSGVFGPRYKVQHPGNKNRRNWEAGREDAYGFVTKELQARGLREIREVWSR